MLRAEQGEQQPASSGGAGVPAPAAAPSVAEQYGAALDAAELEARHTLDFGHAQPSSSSSQALNLISGGVGECAKLCRCTEFVAPAVVRFVEHRGGYNVACGCSGGAHIEALLDIFVAEAQVAGCNGNP